MDKRTRRGFPIIAVLGISFFPILFLYFRNAGEARFSQVLIPVIIVMAVLIPILLVALLLMKSLPKAAIVTVLASLIMLNYALIEKALQFISGSLRYWHIVPVLLVVTIYIGIFIKKKCSDETASIFCLVIAMVSCGLILFNAVMAVPTIYQKQISIAEQNAQQSKIDIQNNANKSGLPNVYLIILDEFSSFNFIQKYYDYDNGEFAGYLENSGFSVSYNSYNESSSTATVIPNLLNLEYIANDKMTQGEKMNLKNNGKLFELMRTNGYLIKTIETGAIKNPDTWPAARSDIPVNILMNTTTDFDQIIIDNSIIYPFCSMNASEYANTILNAFDSIYSEKLEDNGIFTFAHIVCPHEFFVFGRSGEPVSSANWSNYKDKEYYLNQYIYATQLITKAIDEILLNDKNAIIILQSDHSCRFVDGVEPKDKRNILNAVYYQGNTIDEIKDQSGVNTLRLVFGKLLNLDMTTLEVPQSE